MREKCQRQHDLVPKGHNLASALPCYVYFLSDGELVKIGASIRPEHRQTQCGVKGTKLLFALYVPQPYDGYAVETALHDHFRDKRVVKAIGKRKSREWYALTAKDLTEAIALPLYWYAYDEQPTRMGSAHCHCHAKSPITSTARRVAIGIARPKPVGRPARAA